MSTGLTRRRLARWLVPTAQLIVGGAIAVQVVVIGIRATFILLAGIITGAVFQSFETYDAGIYIAGVSVDAAFVLAIIAAVSLFRQPSRRGARFSVVAAACYWVFIIADIIARFSALSDFYRRYPQRMGELLDPRQIVVGAAAVVLAYLASRLFVPTGQGAAETCEVE